MKFYLDTCIWRDYFENREDRFRPLGEWAFKLISKIIEDDDVIIISDHLIRELEKRYSQKEINTILNIVPMQIRVNKNVEKKHIRHANQIKNKYNIPLADALHAAVAKDNGALLITRDKHLDELYRDYEINKPEDLI
jgi:predicted nucleic acid-binding protein